MPAVLVIEGFTFFFYSSEGNEPPHIHVEKAGAKAKWWLVPVTSMSFGVGWKTREMRRMKELVNEHKDQFLQAWEDHFGKS